MKLNKIILFVMFVSLVLASCTNYEYKNETKTNESNTIENLNVTINSEKSNEITGNIVDVNKDNEKVEVTNETLVENKNEKNESEKTLVFKEGDIVDLNPYVHDFDGDNVVLGFSYPFDETGKWQTKKGDAGFYSVIVTATDKKNSLVMKNFVFKVVVKNKTPLIQIKDVLEYKEGDLIVLEPVVFDEDDSEVFVTYSGWMTSKMYQTTYEDAGSYEVVIKADDGKDAVEKKINIVVKDVNREPIIELEKEKYEITEGDILEIKATAKDPDNDKVDLKFGYPLSESGKWETKKGDIGKYLLKVTASDGFNEVKKEIEVNILKKNEPPVINEVKVIPEFVELKQPGEEVNVRIKVDAVDSNNDELNYTFTGDMDSKERTFKYGEKGGLKKVLVTVSDGLLNVSKEITFEVNNWPCFDCQNLVK
ncbi:MAG: hypothetical protein QXM96_03940 [Candidatus Woesearchaeota archaeon]